jgi:hypothetical protein
MPYIFTTFGISTFQHFNISTFQHFNNSTFQHFNLFNISTFQHCQHFNISTFQHLPYYTRSQHFNIYISQHFNIQHVDSTFNVEESKSNLSPPPQPKTALELCVPWNVCVWTPCLWVFGTPHSNMQPRKNQIISNVILSWGAWVWTGGGRPRTCFWQQPPQKCVFPSAPGRHSIAPGIAKKWRRQWLTRAMAPNCTQWYMGQYLSWGPVSWPKASRIAWT